jgi:hypothetical protein
MTVRRSGLVVRTRSCRLPFMLISLALLGAARLIKRFFLGAWL